MIIHCKNGVQADTNPYIDLDERRVLVGNKWIRICELPRIDNEYRLYYLNFGSFIYLITRDAYQDIERCYIIEQKLEKGCIKIENVYTSIEVGKCNTLQSFFKYNKEFERSNLTAYLSTIVDVSLSYVFDGKTLAEQIIEKLDGAKEIEVVEPVQVVAVKKRKNRRAGLQLPKGKSLKDIAQENNIPYQTLWNRVHRRGLSLEKALEGVNK